MCAAAAFAAALGACAGEPSAQRLQAGRWTGDLIAPGVVAAIGFVADVSPSGGALVITALGAMGFDGGAVTGLHLRGDTLSFTWTSEDNRACVLVPGGDGVFTGSCTTPGDDAWTVRLVPPTLARVPVGHAQTILSRTEYAWKSSDHPWGRLHAPGAAATPAIRAADVAFRMQLALDSTLAILGEPAYDRPIDAFLVGGREDLDALVGRPYGSTADPLGSTVILAKFGELGTVMRHEVMHVTSINLWSVPPEPAAWAREGLATFAGGDCAGYSLHQLAASMLHSGDLLPIRTLIDDFHDHSDLITYLESGSLFQYFHATRGTDFTRAVWTGGLEPALAASGQTLDALEAEWRAMLHRPELRHEEVDWTRIRGIGCG